MGRVPPHYIHLISKKALSLYQLKYNNMKKPLNLSNSIYQQKGSGFGLTMKDGMMINNRPDSTTGIQKAVEVKKATRRAEKVSILAQGTSLGNIGGCMDCMNY